jgi:hypothetical protein
MKNAEIINYITGIDKLKDFKFGATISLILAKNKKKLIDEYKTIDELRIEMCGKYATLGEDKKPLLTEDKKGYIFTKEAELEFQEQYKELMLLDSGIALAKFSIGLLDQFKDLTPEQVEILLLFTED